MFWEGLLLIIESSKPTPSFSQLVLAFFVSSEMVNLSSQFWWLHTCTSSGTHWTFLLTNAACPMSCRSAACWLLRAAVSRPLFSAAHRVTGRDSGVWHCPLQTAGCWGLTPRSDSGQGWHGVCGDYCHSVSVKLEKIVIRCHCRHCIMSFLVSYIERGF